jgi:hypothetical protein
LVGDVSKSRAGEIGLGCEKVLVGFQGSGSDVNEGRSREQYSPARKFIMYCGRGLMAGLVNEMRNGKRQREWSGQVRSGQVEQRREGGTNASSAGKVVVRKEQLKRIEIRIITV